MNMSNCVNQLIKSNRNLKRLIQEEWFDFTDLTLTPFTKEEDLLTGFYCSSEAQIIFAGYLFRNCLRKDSRNSSGRIFFFVDKKFKPIGCLDPINATYFDIGNEPMDTEQLRDCLNLITARPIQDYVSYKRECEEDKRNIRLGTHGNNWADPWSEIANDEFTECDLEFTRESLTCSSAIHHSVNGLEYVFTIRYIDRVYTNNIYGGSFVINVDIMRENLNILTSILDTEREIKENATKTMKDIAQLIKSNYLFL
jgi:hypothetical protein